MNDDTNHQILLELRRLRRSNTLAALFCIVLLLAAVVYGWLRLHSIHTDGRSDQAETDSWNAVQMAIDQFDYPMAAAIAQRIVERFPNDYYGYAYLGNIALAEGRTKDAEAHYVRASELLPIEENQKMLGAIRSRLQGEVEDASDTE